MAGARNIKDIVLKDKLIFLHSLLQLPDNATPQKIPSGMPWLVIPKNSLSRNLVQQCG